MLQCELPPNLGPITVNRTDINLEELDETAFPEVKWGGQFSPRNCIALHKVAIIVPYRDRKQLLPIFLNHIHQFLMKQNLIEYGIFIIEQASRHDYFNRGKLLNVGFLASRNVTDWQCFIFHDIDLLPLDQRNIYTCPDEKQPRHHAAAVDSRDFKLTHDNDFSGVSAMTLKQFTKINGYSNTFWGLSGESEDIVLRMKRKGYTISRYNLTTSRYASLSHKPSPSNKNRRYTWYQTMLKAKTALKHEGLATLKFSVKRVTPHRLYTHIVADIGHSPTVFRMLKVMEKFKIQQADLNMRERMDSVKNELIAVL
ncbi:beta-1,4-N-acetylgalactosaminyltransferase bre-4-like [Leguminivora glycinivorella]|uniref:beta-1,4-N-acetylgalactosaminyltransferase bre-4-like n=1 Tax=Leguminivora glycinivorella TaxID=1035111 RepID=UPI00200CCAFD|nr:beta-1,4-N-acetylgalactosaminyltransferase bre-4-like [Leguminivora glycinivorella]